MTKTMIQVDTITRDKIKSLGKMGESFDTVLNKLYKLALKKQNQNYLMDTTGICIIESVYGIKTF